MLANWLIVLQVQGTGGGGEGGGGMGKTTAAGQRLLTCQDMPLLVLE